MKRLVSIILSIMMFSSSIIAFAAEPSRAAIVEINPNAPAITADVGDKISLYDYAVKFDGESAATTDIIWKDLNGNELSEFSPQSTGVTPLVAEANGKKQNVYVVAKEKNESEYALYSADFSKIQSIDELKNEGWTINTANAKIDDGKLLIGAENDDYARVILPAWLADFGDYSMTVNAKMLSTTDEGRWFSLAYRIQNENNGYYPYYHMCIRENTTATNGIEFAMRTSGDTWNVVLTSSAEISSCKNDFNTFNITAKGDTIQYNINGESVVYVSDNFLASNTEKAYYKGMLGITMNKGVTAVSDIKVTLQQEAPSKPAPKLNLINNAHDKLNLINTIANVQSVGTDYEKIIGAEKKPSIVLAKASEIGDLAAYLEKCTKADIIPMVEVANLSEANMAVDALGTLSCKDVTIISTSAEALKCVRDKYVSVRTGLIVELEKSGLTSKEAQEIRKAVRSAPATFCIIENTYASKQVVSELQELAVAVWVKADTSSEQELLKAVTAGADGIITADSAKLADVVNSYLELNSMTRTPVMIGHRGNPSVAPENTISGFIAAYENGADIFELDVEVTKDGEVVIMHDDTITRTTNYTGDKKVNDMTLAEIKEYYILAGDGSVSNEKVPTLREVLEVFKDKDCRIFVEFKGSNQLNISTASKIIKDMGMEDRVDVISFSDAFLKQTQQEMVGMSTGYLFHLRGSSLTVEEALATLYAPLNAAQSIYSTVNPSNDAISRNFLQAATDRGMTVWPWTYYNSNIDIAFRQCPAGITTDDVQWAKNMLKSVSADNTEIKVGKSSELTLKGLTYGGESKKIAASELIVKVISGGDLIDISNGTVTAKGTGEAVLLIGHKTQTQSKSEYVLYSQPITVTLTEGSSSNTAIIIISAIAVAAVAVAVVSAVVITKSKKKK